MNNNQKNEKKIQELDDLRGRLVSHYSTLNQIEKELDELVPDASRDARRQLVAARSNLLELEEQTVTRMRALGWTDAILGY